VNDAQFVECAQAEHHLDKYAPDFTLSEQLALTFELLYFRVQVAAVHILHHDAQRLAIRVQKRFFVTDDVGVPDRGQYPYFIQRILKHFIVESR